MNEVSTEPGPREQRDTAQTRSTTQAQSTSCSHLLHSRQLTFLGGGGRLYCFVVLCFAFIISPCCVLFSLSLRFFFAFGLIYFWYVCTVFFGTYVLFSVTD